MRMSFESTTTRPEGLAYVGPGNTSPIAPMESASAVLAAVEKFWTVTPGNDDFSDGTYVASISRPSVRVKR